MKVYNGQVDEETWKQFIHRWNTYKKQANLTVAAKSHLESCLGDNVTQIQFIAEWHELDEASLLNNVQEVFVKGKSYRYLNPTAVMNAENKDQCRSKEKEDFIERNEVILDTIATYKIIKGNQPRRTP